MNTEVVLNPLGYPLIVADNNYAMMNQLLNKEAESGCSFFILVDENTYQHCVPLLLANVEALAQADIIEIESGETNKTIEICTHLWEVLTENGADRRSVMINLGGGVITDMGGFVSATFKRGIRFYNIPTTLLSQVDASTGSKTGVDLGGLKNQVGVFADPQAVFINPAFLKTLPDNQIQSGYGEILKHALIADKEYWNAIKDKHYTEIEDWTTLILPSLKIKSEIVKEDPKEKGLRKLLNFGHTIGHALETFALENNHPLLHGQAVALGMLAEAWLSIQLTTLPSTQFEEIKKVILRNFELFKPTEADFGRLLELMGHDKKNVSGHVRLTLLNEIGKGVYDIECNPALLKDALRFLISL